MRIKGCKDREVIEAEGEREREKEKKRISGPRVA